MITKFRKDDRFTETAAGTHLDGSAWAEFTIPADRWNPASGAKRSRNLSEEQRAAVAERLKKGREAI